jgi:hypothetical protein
VLHQAPQGRRIVPVNAAIYAPALQERDGRLFVQLALGEALLAHKAAERSCESNPVLEGVCGIPLLGKPFCERIDISTQRAEVRPLQCYSKCNLIRHVFSFSDLFLTVSMQGCAARKAEGLLQPRLNP